MENLIKVEKNLVVKSIDEVAKGEKFSFNPDGTRMWQKGAKTSEGNFKYIADSVGEIERGGIAAKGTSVWVYESEA